MPSTLAQVAPKTAANGATPLPGVAPSGPLFVGDGKRPLLESPQQNRPSVVTAQEWSAPSAIAVGSPGRLLTKTGAPRCSVVPSPRFFHEFSPQQYTLLSAMAHACERVVAT